MVLVAVSFQRMVVRCRLPREVRTSKSRHESNVGYIGERLGRKVKELKSASVGVHRAKFGSLFVKMAV